MKYNLPLGPCDIQELTTLLDQAGYRVIPKKDIGKVGAEVRLDTHYIGKPDLEIYINRKLSEVIGGELRALIHKNTKQEKIRDVQGYPGYDMIRFSAQIEVIFQEQM